MDHVLTRGLAIFGRSVTYTRTGYSSFTYLQTLPVNTVKVDRSFLTAVIERERDGAILRAIVAMARALGLTVVAEGVENIAQLQFLREIGCDRAQGFLLARPGPAEALTALGNAAHPLIASGA